MAAKSRAIRNGEPFLPFDQAAFRFLAAEIGRVKGLSLDLHGHVGGKIRQPWKDSGRRRDGNLGQGEDVQHAPATAVLANRQASRFDRRRGRTVLRRTGESIGDGPGEGRVAASAFRSDAVPGDAAIGQAQPRIVGPQAEPVLGPGRQHAIGLGHAVQDQIVDQHADIGLGTPENPVGPGAAGPLRGVQPRHDPLGGGLFIPGRAIDLACQEKPPDIARLQGGAKARGSTWSYSIA